MGAVSRANLGEIRYRCVGGMRRLSVMARSLHTTPRPIRAARRVKAPYASRRHGAMGQPNPGHANGGGSVPRVRGTRPAAGLMRPAESADVRRVLALLGPQATYGLRAVQLGGGGSHDGRMVFGCLLVPGLIRLYDQPPPPWRITGALTWADQARLERAGAIVHAGLGRVEVHWPGGSLRSFWLLDVLLHELGHHRVQHEQGKRPARTLRTRDHEAAAGMWAQRWQPIAEQALGG
jgi:hypothetical protein